MQLGTSQAGLAQVLVHFGRYLERLLGVEAVERLSSLHVVSPQGRAVRLAGARQRRAKADNGTHGDNRRAVLHRLRHADGFLNFVEAIAVLHVLRMPIIGIEALHRVLGVGEAGGPVERDFVVVVEVNHLAQLQVTGQRGRLRGDALHQVAVAHQHVGVVVLHRCVALFIVDGAEVRLAHSHTQAVGEALAQRAGRYFHAGRHVRLGVARRPGIQLAELLQIIQRQVVAVEVQQAV